MANPIPEPLIKDRTRVVVMFDTTTPDRVGAVLLVEPQSERVPTPYGIKYKYWAPPIWGWHPADDAVEIPMPPLDPVHYPKSVHQFTYLTTYERSEQWVQQHPKKAMLEVLMKAHSEQPKSIGPPYSIVHVVTKNRTVPQVKWVIKGKCPGYTETLGKENNLIEARDEERKANPR